MSSRATAPARPPRGRTEVDRFQDEPRIAVCSRCHLSMPDVEPMISGGEFHHYAPKDHRRSLNCQNHGKRFDIYDLEVVPWMRKRVRRLVKRLSQL